MVRGWKWKVHIRGRELMWLKDWWTKGLRQIERVGEQQNEKYISVDLVWIWLGWMMIFEPFAWIWPCRRLVFCVDGRCSSADYDAIRRLLRVFWTNDRQDVIRSAERYKNETNGNGTQNRPESRINTKNKSRLAHNSTGRLFFVSFYGTFCPKNVIGVTNRTYVIAISISIHLRKKEHPNLATPQALYKYRASTGWVASIQS